MCRRCGEPDRRGSAESRRRSRQHLLDLHGNGVICPCTWCPKLVGNRRGYLTLPDGTRLYIEKLERDRLMPGGPYARWNLVPSCPGCNKARTYQRVEIPEGCEYGPSQWEVDSDRAAA